MREAPAKRPPGRPTKLSPEVQNRIVDALMAGNYLETAASYGGVTKETVYQWLRKGATARKGSPLRAFSDAVRAAIAESEVALVTQVAKAAETDWRAALGLLERRFPDRYAPRQRLDLGKAGKGDEAGVIRVKLKLAGTE